MCSATLYYRLRSVDEPDHVGILAVVYRVPTSGGYDSLPTENRVRYGKGASKSSVGYGGPSQSNDGV